MVRGRNSLARGLAFALAAFLLLLASEHAEAQSGCSTATFTSVDVPRAIPDPGFVESAIDVPASNDPVASVTVRLAVAHAFDSDVKIELTSPQGTSVTLAEAVGLWGHDFTDTRFDDAASSSIISQLPPFTGTFRPAEPLAAFAGFPRGGTWRLRVTDLRARYSGQLQSWRLDITTCPNAQRWQKPLGAPAAPPLPDGVPSGHINVEGTLITVTNSADENDSFPTTVAHLLSNPGPDGKISLREAIEATNHDPGTYTIRFASSLRGASINVGAGSFALPYLPSLSGGSVLVDGDIDGDGRPDVTITDVGTDQHAAGLVVDSGGNRIHALAVRGFPQGILLTTPWVAAAPSSHLTLARNVVSGVEVTSKDLSGHGFAEGIFLRPNIGHPECDSTPCDTHNTWSDIRIVGNRVVSDRNGIEVAVTGTNGDQIERLTVAGNDIQTGAAFSTTNGFGINVTAGWSRPGGSDNRLSDALIAYNSAHSEGAAYAINVGAGSGCGTNNVVEDLGVVANHVQFASLPAIPEAARGFQFAITDGCGQPDPGIHDAVRRVRIIGNVFSGQDDAGVMVNEPCCGENPGTTLSDVVVSENLIQGIVPPSELNPWGIVVGGRLSVSNVTIDSNTVEQQTTEPETYHIADLAGGGIALVGGLGTGYITGGESLMRDIFITNNRIATDLAGITLLGGGPSDQGDTDNTRGHTISGVALRGNVIERTPVLATRFESAIKGISLIGGLGATPPATPSWWRDTSGCNVAQVAVDGNLVSGVADDASVIANIGEGASGNSAAAVIHARAVDIVTSGFGSGTVTSIPGAIGCGPSCAMFELGTTATLIATAVPGSIFSGWSGDCSGTGACTLSMNSDHAVVATFDLCPLCPGRRRAVRHLAALPAQRHSGTAAQRHSGTAARG